MKKILLLSHTSPPIHGSSIIGDSVLSCLKDSIYFDIKYINISTSKTLKKSLLKLFYSIYNFISIIFKTLINLLRFRPDIIYITPTVTNYGFYKDLILIVIVKFYKIVSKNTIRIVLHIHMRPYKSSNIQKVLYPFFFNNSEVILLSNILIKDFNFHHFKKCQIHILPNFINIIKDTNISKRKVITDLKNDNINVLYLGHMIESKGYKRALVLASKICKIHPNFKFNFYGHFFDRKNYNFFINFLKSNNLCNNVKYLGFCSNEQKEYVFLQNNILIMPSYSEAFPLVILESLSNGLPIVATNTGAIKEIVNDYGSVITYKNDEDLFIDDFIFGIFDTIKNFNLSKSLSSSEYISTKYNYEAFKKNLLLILKIK